MARALRAALPALAILLLFACGEPARAHDLRLALLRVSQDASGTSASLTAHLHQFRQVDPREELARRLRLTVDGRRFVPGHVFVMRDGARGILAWDARSGLTGRRVTLEAPIFPEQEGGRTVIVLLRGGRVVGEEVLTADSGPVTLTGDESGGVRVARTVGRFLHEGLLHIFLGFDHILFVICLLLLGGSVWQLIKVVTAFTLAHSVTLSLAATGMLTLPPRLVEPVIALSIVLVAAANLLARARPVSPREAAPAPASDAGGATPRPYPEPTLRSAAERADFRPGMAFGFGLIHGVGFAGALSEIGLPSTTLGWALGSFNVGVELGQAAIVLAVAPLLALLARRSPEAGRRVVLVGSALALCAGCLWLIERLTA